MTEEKELLVADNLKLVHYIVRNKFFLTPVHKEYDDYVSVGNLYLCLAAENYDSHISKFSTYASSCIIGGIQTYKNRLSSTIRLPRNLWSVWTVLCTMCVNPYEPSKEELDSILKSHPDIEMKDIQDCRSVRCISSLDAEIVNESDNSSSSRYDMERSVDSHMFEDDVAFTQSIQAWLDEILSDPYRFTEKERMIIRTAMNHAYTRGYVRGQDIGKILGISQSYCSRVLTKFKKQLREWLDEQNN